MSPSRLQRVVNLSYKAFKHVSNSGCFAPELLPSDIAAIVQEMNQLRLADIGLTSVVMDELANKITTDFWAKRRAWRGIKKNEDGTPLGPAHFVHIFENDCFNVTLILMPPGCWLPLHDHCGMTVFTKVLHGSMKVTSLDFKKKFNDWHEGRRNYLAEEREAITRENGVYTNQDETLVLTPSGTMGSIHEFRALETTAFLDIMGPPYGPDRNCHYFIARKRDHSSSKRSELSTILNTLRPGETVILEEVPVPREYLSSSSPYRGPPVTQPEEG